MRVGAAEGDSLSVTERSEVEDKESPGASSPDINHGEAVPRSGAAFLKSGTQRQRSGGLEERRGATPHGNGAKRSGSAGGSSLPASASTPERGMTVLFLMTVERVGPRSREVRGSGRGMGGPPPDQSRLLLPTRPGQGITVAND